MSILNKLGILSFMFVCLTGFVHMQEEISGDTPVTVVYQQGESNYSLDYFINVLKGV